MGPPNKQIRGLFLPANQVHANRHETHQPRMPHTRNDKELKVGQEYNPAPTNQPTSNIRFQLEHARTKQDELEYEIINLRRRADNATLSARYWDARVAELEWQIKQRKESE